MTTIVEVRCVDNPRRLFAKLRTNNPTEPLVVTDGNLMEFVCRDCQIELGVARVFHRFDFAGRFVETEILHTREYVKFE